MNLWNYIFKKLKFFFRVFTPVLLWDKKSNEINQMLVAFGKKKFLSWITQIICKNFLKMNLKKFNFTFYILKF